VVYEVGSVLDPFLDSILGLVEEGVDALTNTETRARRDKDLAFVVGSWREAAAAVPGRFGDPTGSRCADHGLYAKCQTLLPCHNHQPQTCCLLGIARDRTQERRLPVGTTWRMGEMAEKTMH
jgi:hypothetical protein